MKIEQKTIDIVKATAPVIKEHGVAITTHFYKLMFEKNPELKNVFNMAHQAEGTQPQVLAGAILGYATYIDNLPMLQSAVERIAHKHVSLSIQPAHYAIVGKHLIQAIKDILGDAATEDIIAAWTEAYGILAGVFTQREGSLYTDAINNHNGWVGFKNFIVSKKVIESDEITSFYLKPEEGSLLPFIPGQYIAVRLKGDDHEHAHMRNYSLSDSPEKDYYRISVKREQGYAQKPDGIGSNYLHDFIGEGDVIEVGIPAGDFTLDTASKRDVVLLSGGVGQTPMLSMLNHLLAENSERKITWLHAAKNGLSHAFNTYITELATKNEQLSYQFIYNNPQPTDKGVQAGFIDISFIKDNVPNYKEAEYYFCGPKLFMKNIINLLAVLGVPEEQINFEFFGPAEELKAETEAMA
ncbi:NO-inducible flavohemoprotein [Flammeovirga kamogawensis]|uniref:Flavohemoprotein n=1 Tax=Flammeovirga kamogawensis TaxID=373891 RepID=A0ABX8H2S3_9BACT|nr:NO-inducible flavohemoprotein [Flammeovirga kamogawensis]MBB6460151.1 nitric oxide dioxygenase [Flammeovirga kamogawensis]QWG09964.1 NO-inducible flavohemoprotein [Flammeovirga kamogawensis]TRX65471.1 NO-inducible flavohemoprotein [Flammeovirga kamogawensis]